MMKTTPKSSQSTVFQVESPDTLLNFLLEHVKNKSRNTVKGFLSKRQVKVGSKTVTAFDYALKPGQTVTILPPADQRAPKLPFPVIYEDADLIVIDKPAGLLTVATDRERDKTAYRILTDYLAGPGKEKPLFIVHRLDRDTSGVVLFAKNQEMKEALQEDWEDLVDRRVYLAAVEGRPPEERGTVKSFLRETSTHLVYSGAPTRCWPGGRGAPCSVWLWTQGGRTRFASTCRIWAARCWGTRSTAAGRETWGGWASTPGSWRLPTPERESRRSILRPRPRSFASCSPRRWGRGLAGPQWRRRVIASGGSRTGTAELRPESRGSGRRGRRRGSAPPKSA